MVEVVMEAVERVEAMAGEGLAGAEMEEAAAEGLVVVEMVVVP